MMEKRGGHTEEAAHAADPHNHDHAHATRGGEGHGMVHPAPHRHHHAHAPHASHRPHVPATPEASAGEHRARHPNDHAARDPHAGHDAHTGNGGHDKHAGHSVAMFRDRFWISLALTIPTLVWGHMLQMALGYTAPRFPGSQWIAPVLGIAVFLYGGRVFIEGALGELRARLPGMMTLIALAITVAFVFSVAVLLGFPGMPLWEELATLVTIMLLGHWVEMRSISQAQGAVGELAKLLPSLAVRIREDGVEEVPVSELREGDLVLVRPGAGVPADGVVRSGTSAVNESMITGESRPVEKAEGAAVIAGTVNGSGALRVAVTGTGEGTALAGIMRLVRDAQSSRSRAQALADRAAFVLTLVALASGALTLAVWLALGAEPAYAVERMVTTLVIACPHALGLAIPLVVAISTTLGARGGLLVRDRRGLEEARSLDVVVFDKTGTLTLGEHRVVGIATVEGLSEDEALRLAAAVEQDSEHPVAHAVVLSARERGLTLPAASDFQAIPGRGVRARVEGRALEAGGPNLLADRGLEPAAALRALADSAAAAGRATIYLVDEHRLLAAFALADAIRPESKEAVATLRAHGVEVAMLTGDAEPVARAVATELGIGTVFAQVLPEQKAARIRALQATGKRVAMVGDGVNDAPALLSADVGVAIGAGTDVAVEAGDVVLVRSDPRDVPRIIALSRATYRKMIQNLWWATGYNVVAIPLAAGVLAPWGLVLSPAIGAVLMSLSTLIVAANAQLLRRVRL
jgi:Cu2+-exporting ATPase